MRRHDGQYRWMLGNGVPRFLKDGKFAGFVGSVVDITDHRAAAVEAQKQAQCTAAVANAAGLFYVVLDPEGRVEHPDPQSVLRGLIWETSAVAPQEAPAIREAVQQAAATRAVVRARTTTVSEQGEPLDRLWTITPIVSPAGELGALVATVSEADRFEGPAARIVRSACRQVANTADLVPVHA